MTKQSIYPTSRQKAFFEGADATVEDYHLITSGSFMFFRFAFKSIIFIYIVLAIMGGFELLSIVLAGKDVAKTQMLSTGMTTLILVLSVTMGMVQNQILLILGHGYKSKDAQLYVDRLTKKEDCSANLAIIKSMYIIAVVIALALLWLLWGMFGTPMYSGEFSEQVAAISSVVKSMNAGAGVSDMVGSSKQFKPFLWFGGIALITAALLAAMGWVQATIARARL